MKPKIVRVVRIICYEADEDTMKRQLTQSIKDGTHVHGAVTTHITTLHEFPFLVGTADVARENEELRKRIEQLESAFNARVNEVKGAINS